ncbi:MAG: TetR/AcrR family transcriptional regulator [Lachnospiraceae bacterium]|jgi:AcrR family transcriptional regulator|nr:TetR/AcrR family transcriptional regulator [Lachnospiraceae bacterium]MBR3574946.1 TetR/AcrR family transcriptional regulator [Lachnospiraceae bacterium]
MGDKSVQKKQYIIDVAAKVFAEKGYKNVTMKDVVDACDISRGGLYLYYESTTELFIDVMKSQFESREDFTELISDDATAADILLLFLQEEKKELFRKKGNLNRAYYEFYFDLRPSKGDNVYKKEFDSNVKMICKLIEIGVESGEFVCDDPLTAALNIVYVLEGMKTTALTLGVSPDSFDRQILYILQSLGVDA